MESGLQPDKVKIDSDVVEVGSMMQFHEAMLQELCSSMHILQGPHNQIVDETTNLFPGIHREQENMSKRITDDSLQILAVKSSNQTIQEMLAAVTQRIDKVNKAMVARTTSLKNMPTKRKLCQCQDMIDDQFTQVDDINTGLTTAMEAYKVSKSASFHVEQQAGPSGTPSYIHPHRVAAMEQLSILVSSPRDTENEFSSRARMRGGAGFNGAAGGAGNGAAGGADNGAAGGANNGTAGHGAGNGGGGAAGDPLPPDPRPSDHGGARGRSMSR